METQHGISEALDCGYITPEHAEQLNLDLAEIGRMLNSMMEKSHSFCGSPDTIFRESIPTYFAEPPITEH